MIKVVDLFAGPGGLSEGFSAVRDDRGRRVFDIVLSVEMDRYAYQTLLLRAFYRQFSGNVPSIYYQHLRGEATRVDLYEKHPEEAAVAQAECWHATLGPNGVSQGEVRKRIVEAVGTDEKWVLIGGPPCQAYSVAGRSRNQGNPEYDPKKDVRQRLYVEYLQILAEHRPAVFIMENVKGLLSATLENEHIFHRILNDLRNPATAIDREGRWTRYVRSGGYQIYSLAEHCQFENGNLQGAVIRAEQYGIPQARHRVILLGVRDDLHGATPDILKPRPEVPLSAVLTLPRLRSGLSRIVDTADNWRNCLRSQINSRWANAGTRSVDSEYLSTSIRRVLADIEPPENDRGGEFVPGEISISYAKQWYCDNRLEGTCNHFSRAHMEKDLYRYLYAACYARLRKRSPSLACFPTDLLPDHVSADDAVESGGFFSDRFRVQVASRPSTTIVSHISKDGHYYIHPDPRQCRSLTVREAARLQTFPDNYFFCGPRTSQFVQVGNAVPPLLAKQIGSIAFDLLSQAGDSN
ncbi:MAG TPA: DNA (cytosine-5-)-methyltransferase [Candidatus Fermentibacter daniensis]|nr:DNA (cytosine-5-)-methyltransferase [Candidatus Fermentibacter daniensis]HOR07411.1 DNA (cytosine-5-)-methyltransferase [Candidatus Fermentibacter daniensis]HPK51387.1 DNA (cytosine-5-)-methyltransferase [Candidatus Fermentibacter daniensis]HPO41004.1 DNA (cytosine-5-)-methyltransferase [Bacteroidales bacterium]